LTTGATIVHPVQVSQWKKAAAEGLAQVFANPASTSRTEAAREALIARLYQEVGQLKVELDWLVKKNGGSPSRASAR